MKSQFVKGMVGGVAGAVAALGFLPGAWADLRSLGPTDATPLQLLGAATDQAIYDRLIQPDIGCSEGLVEEQGVSFFQVPAKSAASHPPPVVRALGDTCSGGVLAVFEVVAALVDTANTTFPAPNGSTALNLGLNARELADAVQVTTAEEFAGMGETALRFNRLQHERLDNRLLTLRLGPTAVVASSAAPLSQLAVAGHHALGGGASADTSGLVSPWGIYLDGSYNYGHRDDTANGNGFEDGYRFSGDDITLGVDYRFADSLVLGFMTTHTNRRENFDVSQNIVDAVLGANGWGGTLYGLWEPGDAFLQTSFGYQWLDHTTTRNIIIPSHVMMVPSIDAVAGGRTRSQAFTFTLDAGYDFRRGSFTAEPYLKGQLQHVDISGFTEGGQNVTGFDETFGSQRFDPIDTAVGLKLQNVFTPGFGVIVPYARGEYHHEFDSHVRNINGIFTGILSLGGSNPGLAFNIPTDKPDNDYMIVAAGASAVLPHGLQGFLQYQQILGEKPYSDRTVSGGVRWEF